MRQDDKTQEELNILQAYMPQPLTDAELEAIVATEVLLGKKEGKTGGALVGPVLPIDHVLGNVSPVLGIFAFMFFVNLYWAVGGYLKITYFTCFYMWARECERQGSSDPRLAPAPLQAAMAS